MRLTAQALAVTFLLSLAAPAAATDLGSVTIQEKTYDQGTGQLQVTISNLGEKTLTAWTLSLVALGEEARTQLQLDYDYHIRLLRSPEQAAPEKLGGGLITPGKSQTLAVDVEPPASATGTPVLSVRLLAVIFDDGSALGEPGAVQRLFSQRTTSAGEVYRAWQAVAQIRRGYRDALVTATALKDHALALRGFAGQGTLGRQDASPPKTPGHRQDMAERLEAVARAIERQPASGAELMNALEQNLRAEYEFRIRHTWFDEGVGDPTDLPSSS